MCGQFLRSTLEYSRWTLTVANLLMHQGIIGHLCSIRYWLGKRSGCCGRVMGGYEEGRTALLEYNVRSMLVLLCTHTRKEIE